MTFRTFGYALLLALMAMLGSVPTAQAMTPTPATSPQAYLDSVIGYVREKAKNSDSVAWDAVTVQAQAMIEGAADTVDTYGAIVFVLEQLGDHHSFLQVPAEKRALYKARHGVEFDAGQVRVRAVTDFRARTQPESRELQIGTASARLVVVPGFMRGPDEAQVFSRSIFDALASSPSATCGYVVDLRGNWGGNTWPMLAGLSPLYGSTAEVGRFLFKGDRTETWFIRNGVSGYSNNGQDLNAFELQGWRPALGAETAPVAVLIDGGTASSGEATAISFRGRPNTRFFGAKTYGIATSNEGATLEDGANVVVTTGFMLDRNGTAYAEGVHPDVEVDPSAPEEGAQDVAVEAARSWLAEQPSCRAT